MNIELKKLRDLTRLESVTDNCIFLVYNPDTGKTHFVMARDLLLSDGSFPTWSSEDSYDTGAKVQYALRLWESLIDDNEGNVPTEGANWTEVSPDAVVVSVLDQVLTGLSLASTADVSALDTVIEAFGKLQANKARTFFKDGSQAMEGDIDLNSYKLKQLAAATANGEAVNFEQLNAALDGLKPKDDCRAATTADITLNDEQTIDGVAVVDGDRVLVKDQADASENGIYVVVDDDDWVRSTDADTAIELQGALVQIDEGTVNEGTAWTQYSVDITLETDDILWRQISSTVPDATATTKGKMKLFADLLNNYTDGSVTQAAINTALAALAIVIQNSTSTTVSIAGTDTYTGALAPAITSHVKGQTFKLTDVTANTVTNPTLNLNGLGAKNLVNYKNAALAAGDFVGTVIVMYDGTAFRMIGGGGGSVVASGITVTPAGGISSTNVQAALQELDTEKANLASPTFTGPVTTPAIIVSGENASRLAIIDASKNVKSADTSTYPSLAEVANLKGLTSPIQTQLDAKALATEMAYALNKISLNLFNSY